MSALTDAAKAIKDVMRLTDDVKEASALLKDLASELREHDRRITRLEAQWDTTLQMAALRRIDGPK